MNKFEIRPISIERSANTPFLRLNEVVNRQSFGQLSIVASSIRAPINQCPGCQRVCRNTSGDVWMLAANPVKMSIHVVGTENGPKRTELMYDTRYSTFCTYGTEISSVTSSFNPYANGEVQIIPAEGIPHSKDPYNCPFDGFKKI